jgi:hypothetical protein
MKHSRTFRMHDATFEMLQEISMREHRSQAAQIEFLVEQSYLSAHPEIKVLIDMAASHKFSASSIAIERRDDLGESDV